MLRRLFLRVMGYTVVRFRGAVVLDCVAIQAVFERQFGHSHRTRLIGGAPEPLYLPAEKPEAFHQLIYTLDYPASALHEIAHWCLASERQLQLKDWGHWYVPDGRNVVQQQRFQEVEARVQALEWILSRAAGRPFRESSDNLGGEACELQAFRRSIHQQVSQYCERGLPPRAHQLAEAFAAERGHPFVLHFHDFDLLALGPEAPLEQVAP